MNGKFKGSLAWSTILYAIFLVTGIPARAQVLGSEESAFLTLINNFRAQNGAGPLQISSALEGSSGWMSNDMASKNYFSHTDSLGRDPFTRMSYFGYTHYPEGENIAAGYSDAQNAFNQWLTACDPDGSGNCTYAHRQNMLNPSFQAIGIGRAYNGSSLYRWYWTTDFGGLADSGGPPPPPAAPTIGFFNATPSTITAGQPTTLSWSVSGATTVSIDNGVGDVSNLTATLVSPNQTTTYTLTARNSGGAVTAQTTVVVSTAFDTQPPTTPTIISATAKSGTEVDLIWTASTDNVGVAGYQVIRNGSIVATVPGGTVSYADTTTSAGTAYTYFVRAFDAAGNYSGTSNGATVTTPSVPAGGNCPGPATGLFTGCYYRSLDLSGNPTVVRSDSQINFDWWNNGPPDRSLANGFSVRWQGNFTFDAGTYTFTALTSDGMRVYIDGNLVLDRWRDQPTYMYVVRPTLSQGNHLITVEYYSRSGGGTANLSWQNNSPSVQPPAINSFTATPATITAGQSAILSWSVSGASTVSIDNGVGDVSNATSRAVSPSQTTTYTLTATGSGGSVTSRTTITVSTFVTQPPTAPSIISAIAKSATEVDLAWTASTGVAGYQIIRNGSVIGTVSGGTIAYADTSASGNTVYTYFVKAFDAAGNYSAPSNGAQVTTPAAPPVSGTCPAPATNSFTGCYYNNVNLTGNPAFVSTDSQINFDWWANGPRDSSVSLDNFSVRWQGNFYFDQGSYTFTTLTSDGVRLYIDGNLMIDRWRDQPPYIYLARPTLSQGNHLITMEYYDHTGSRVASLSWQKN